MTDPYYTDDAVALYAGDCLDVLPTLPDASVDAVVTDPPAGISFMGRDWDHHKGGREQWAAWLAEVMREAYRVAKPGAHALVWALPRTSHWTAIGIEDAGWEIRDRITHLFGTGFPKSLDVSKAIDRAAGAEREVVGPNPNRRDTSDRSADDVMGQATGAALLTAPATADAQRRQGWGTALKPAAEDWWLARKPLVGTVAANVLAHGTGALNVDACRIGTDENLGRPPAAGMFLLDGFSNIGDLRAAASRGEKTPKGRDAVATLRRYLAAVPTETNPAGRWPANVALDETAAAALDHMSGESGGGPITANGSGSGGIWSESTGKPAGPQHGDFGGASRFFYTAKAGSDERITHDGVAHPTVKPLSLMRWLVRLVTPPGGLILEPFAGSGTTIEAALIEGFRCIAIEREADYLPLITQRINRRRDPITYLTTAGEDLGLFGDTA